MTETKHHHHVFICHASEDKPLVRELYNRLTQDGIDAWLDEEKLLPGQDWQLEISKAVKNSEVILVVLSSQSVKKAGYVQKEIKLALDVSREKPEGTIYLIPARLDDCAVPDSLKNYHWVNLFDNKGYERLKQALDAKIGLPQIEKPTRSIKSTVANFKNTQVTVILERDVIEFTPAEQASFKFALSRMVNVNPDQIRILHIASGSVILTLEMPEESAEILVSLFLQRSSLLSELLVTKVELKHHQAPIPSATSIPVVTELNSKTISENIIYTTNNYESSVFVSYAWGGESEATVNKLEEAFSKHGITIVRDKRDLAYKGSIEEFEQRIAKGQCVVIVISDKYLRSEHCMYELVELENNQNLRERVFPIVLPDAKIYKAIDRLNYIKHWEEQIEQLNKAIKQINVVANLAGISADLDKYTRIRASFDRITDLLSDMNTLTPDMHTENDFSILINAVEYTITKQGKIREGLANKLPIPSKGDTSESILRVYDEISKLMNTAIKDADDFGIMVERTDGRSRKERKEIAFKSKDAFYEYYESKKHYFPLAIRNDIEALNELIERSLRGLAICFNTMENMERDLKTPPHQTLMPQQITEIHEKFLSRSKPMQDRILDSFLEYRKSLVNVSQEKPKQIERFDISPSVVLNDEKWVSVIVPNPTNQTLECYCVLKSVSLNGNINETVKRYVCAHSSRISWSGGDTVGKDEGVKVIDDSHMLNVVSPTRDGLGFEMAKGTRSLGDDFKHGIGTYKINLEIRYKVVGEKDFQSKDFSFDFVCYIEESKIGKESIPSGTIRYPLIPIVVLGDESREYLYVKIL